MSKHLHAILDGLQGGQKDRHTALTEFRQCLSDGAEFSLLESGQWECILNIYCSAVVTERSDFLRKLGSAKGLPKATETKLHNTLEVFATTFRALCETGQSQFPPKVVRRIIDHILEVLPHGEGLFKPFAWHYPRALRTILSYQTHRLQIPIKKWRDLLNLCISNLTSTTTPDISLSQENTHSTDSPISQRSSQSRFSFSRRSSQIPTETVDIARCLGLLIISSPREIDTPTLRQILQTIKTFIATHSVEHSSHLPLLSSLCHIFYEYAPNHSGMVWEYLVMTCPFILRLWEIRPSPIKPLIINIFRFYLRLARRGAFMTNMISLTECWCPEQQDQYSPASEGGDCPSCHNDLTYRRRRINEDYRTFVKQLWELVSDEIASKAGIGHLPTPELFIRTTLTRRVSPASTENPLSLLPLLTDPAKYNLDNILERDFTSYTFLDLASDCLSEMIYIENHPISEVVANGHRDENWDGTNNPSASATDLYSPRVRKRARGTDVVYEIRSIVTRTGNKTEKVFVVQVLSFLFWKFGIDPGDAGEGEKFKEMGKCLLGAVEFDDREGRGWSFVCCGCAALCGAGDGMEEGWKRAWKAGGRRVREGGVGVEGAVFYMGCVVRNRALVAALGIGGEASSIAEHLLGSGDVTVGTLEFLRGVGIGGGEEGVGGVDVGRILEWCLRCDEGSQTNKVGTGGGVAVPTDVLVRFLVEVSELGRGDERRGTSEEDSCPTLHPPSTKPKDEFVAEWRLQTVCGFVKRVLSGDVFRFGINSHAQNVPSDPTCTSSTLTTIVDVLTHHLERLSQSFPVTPSPTSILRTSSIPSIAIGLYHAVERYLKHDARTSDVDITRLRTAITNLASSIVDAITETGSDVKFLEEVVGWVDTGQETSFSQNLLDRITGIALNAMEGDTSTSPSLSGMDVDSPTPKTPKRGSAADLDDFERVVTPGRGAGGGLSVGLNAEYFGGGEEGGRSVVGVGLRICGSVRALRGDGERVLGVVCGLIEGGRVVGIEREVVGWVETVGDILEKDQTCALLNALSTLLLHHEKNPWMQLFTLRCLTALIPSVTIFQNGDEEIRNLAGMFLRFFRGKAQGEGAFWRVCVEFGRFVGGGGGVFGGGEGREGGMEELLGILGGDLRVAVWCCGRVAGELRGLGSKEREGVVKGVEEALVGGDEGRVVVRMGFWVEVAVFCVGLRERAVFEIIDGDVPGGFVGTDVVRKALTAVADRLGFRTEKALLAQVMPGLLEIWVARGRGVVEFPFCGVGWVVGLVVLWGLGSGCGGGVGWGGVGGVVGWFGLILMGVGEVNGEEEVRSDDGGGRPRFEFGVELRALGELAELVGGDGRTSKKHEGWKGLFSPEVVQRVLQDYQVRIEDAWFVEEKRRLIRHGYVGLMAIAGSVVVSHPLLFGCVVGALVRWMKVRECVDVCCAVLMWICRAAKGEEEMLGRELVEVVPAIGEIAKVYERGGDVECAGRVVGLLEGLIELLRGAADGDAARLALVQLDPEARVLGGLRKKFERDVERGDVGLVERLLGMRNEIVGTRIATVMYVRRCLEDEGFVRELVMEGNEGFLRGVVRRMVEFGRGVEKSETLAVEVGRCLGRVVPLVSGRVMGQERVKNDVTTMGSSTKAYVGHVVALRHLMRYCAVADARFYGTVAEALRGIFRVDEGRAALEVLDGEGGPWRIFCDPGRPSASSTGSTVATTHFGDDALWSLDAVVEQDESGKIYNEWAVNMATSLLASFRTDDVFPHLLPIFAARPGLAEDMFPYLVHRALLTEISESTERKLQVLLATQYRKWLDNVNRQHPSATRTLLLVVEFLRTQSRPEAETPFDNNQWFDLDFIALANGAVQIKSYASALLYLEISLEPERNSQLLGDRMDIDTDDNGSSSERDVPLTRSSLLMEIYRSIDDSDGFEGVIASRSSEGTVGDFGVLIQKHETAGEWGKVFGMRETQLKGLQGGRKEEVGAHLGLMTSLGRLGFNHVLDCYGRSLGGVEGWGGEEKKEFEELHYESLWKCERWDVGVGQVRNGAMAGGANRSIYQALRSLRQGDSQGTLANASRGLLEEVTKLRSLSLDYISNVFNPLRALTLFVEIEEAVAIARDCEAVPAVLGAWKGRMEKLSGEYGFADLENIFALRSVALGLVGDGCVDAGVRDMLKETLYWNLVDYGKAARKTQNLQTAQYVLARANSICKVGDGAGEMRQRMLNQKLPNEGVVQLLKTMWMQGDRGVAVRTLKAIVNAGGGDTQPLGGSRKSAAEGNLLCQLGKWIAQSRSENPRYVLETYFEEAAQAVGEGGSSRDRGRAYNQLARYADEQYTQMLANDPREQLADLLSHKEAELRSCEALAKAIAGKDRASEQQRLGYEFIKRRLSKQIDIDKKEEQRYLSDRATFLRKAVENYLRTLQCGEGRWDMSVFRLCGLWFANTTETQINATVDAHIREVPSHKFLELMYQLSARMSAERGGDEGEFQRVLQKLIYRMAKEHPHQCLYQIIALKNGGEASRGRSSSSSRSATLQSSAATHILSKLRAIPTLTALIQNMDVLCDAYIELAWCRFDHKADKKKFRFERKWMISGVRDLEGVPVVSREVEIDPTGERYRSLPYVVGFAPEFSSPGGVNLPKVVDCIDSEGRSHKQLVKGNDDLRQDAVLSKIFSILNVLLRKDLETRKRNLSIRTYKVVPLAPRAGLLEWVENTAPFGELSRDCHRKYNRGDWTAQDCRKRLDNEHGRGNSDSRSKLAVFKQIEKHFRPAFRHFFFEQFLDAVDWFQKRQSYARSVASNSIAGYVVGLGDRHAQNILVDKQTAEVVHIDLGIAFDQGKLLSTPEVVPFRLTRDIVDGMGVSGVEGTFRHCCEHTLRVLRAESDIVSTILDVFRYDPLYNWKKSLVDEERKRLGNQFAAENGLDDVAGAAVVRGGNGTQGGTQQTQRGKGLGNKEAERALLGVQKKLSNGLSVEYQVNELIQSAVDERNLCEMFPGW
ncbi:hypothetical protein HDV00_008352 [Rhizophlyctis rosea]|nr:hypothetical protein HDV00_008352 [Rhizophlyctis rosea]